MSYTFRKQPLIIPDPSPEDTLTPTPYIRILFVGKRKKPIVWASEYLENKYKLARWRMLDGVGRIVKLIYGPISYYKFSWEKRFNVYNALYRHDHEVWVKYLERRLGKLNRGLSVDDPHYINEVNYLVDKLGFIVVRITMATDLKPTIGKALLDSDPGSVLLQEYYGGNKPAYKVDYSISVSDRQGLYVALDELMEKLKLTKLNMYNISEGSQEEPISEVINEEISSPYSRIDRGNK